MRHAVLGAGLAVFSVYVWAVRYHFVAHRPSPRFVGLSALSGANMAVFAWRLWRKPQEPLLLAVALVMLGVAALLFIWTLRTTWSARLKLIFDRDDPQSILSHGPYRWIRHPFYASYIVFYCGCAVATLHPVNIAFAVLVTAILAFAAREEERGFAQSDAAEGYAAYRRTAGLFWPRLF